MKSARSFVMKLATVTVLAVFGMGFAAYADSVTLNSTFYYAGPETGTTDNPFSIVNANGNAISTLALTSAGSSGTLVLNTTGNPGISLTGSDFTVQLYGNTSAMVTGSTINTGTYTFNSASDYFGIETAGGTTGYGGAGLCNTGQTCNSGSNPIDDVTINVAQNGVVTLQSSSLELVASDVPEMDRSNALASLVLVGGVVTIFRGRRKKPVRAVC